MFDFMEFTNGKYKCLVFSKKYYEEKDIKTLAIAEWECAKVELSEIYDGYVRYYPKTPVDMQHDFGKDGVWTFCDKGRGAIAVWVVDLEDPDEIVARYEKICEE